MAARWLRKVTVRLLGYRPRPGDVVRDAYSGKLMTVEYVTQGRIETVHFEGSQVKRGSLLTRGVQFVR